MNKGLVYQISQSYIIVHCDDGRYLKLKKKNHLEIGSYIAFFEKDIIKPNTKKVMSVLSVAALLLIAFFMQPFMFPSRAVYAIVGIDSLSSVEYAVDSEGKVIEMNAYNEVGEKILHEDYLGMTIGEVVSKSVHKVLELGFSSEEDILISETLMNDDSNYIINDESLNRLAEDYALENLYVIRPEAAIREEAKRNNVSIARMFLADTIANATNQTVDAILDQSISDMLNELDDSLEDLKKIDQIIEDTTDEVRDVLDKVQYEMNKLEKIPFLKDVMKDVNKELKSLDDVIDEVESQLPSVEEIIEDVKKEIKDSLND